MGRSRKPVEKKEGRRRAAPPPPTRVAQVPTGTLQPDKVVTFNAEHVHRWNSLTRRELSREFFCRFCGNESKTRRTRNQHKAECHITAGTAFSPYGVASAVWSSRRKTRRFGTSTHTYCQQDGPGRDRVNGQATAAVVAATPTTTTTAIPASTPATTATAGTTSTTAAAPAPAPVTAATTTQGENESDTNEMTHGDSEVEDDYDWMQESADDYDWEQEADDDESERDRESEVDNALQDSIEPEANSSAGNHFMPGPNDFVVGVAQFTEEAEQNNPVNNGLRRGETVIDRRFHILTLSLSSKHEMRPVEVQLAAGPDG
ncbi:hypothetical protein F4779DRAFT_621047 [Xylariaceae sp. FL0662B]|nr:hypothetical protein F4779DRAFT_621047 [Xylariaceae sp. FL0662B]